MVTAIARGDVRSPFPTSYQDGVLTKVRGRQSKHTSILFLFFIFHSFLLFILFLFFFAYFIFIITIRIIELHSLKN